MHAGESEPLSWHRWCALLVLAGLLLALPVVGVFAQNTGHWVHAYPSFGPPKYPAGYDHFDFANRDAPKGGSLYLRNPDRRSSFDKFNPFTVRGSAPAGVTIFMFESLCVEAADELQTMYGLLAEEMFVAPDKSYALFRLNPKARFNNGDPVTAADVKHSFDMLSSKYASPAMQNALSSISKVEVVDERTIRFELKDKNDDTLTTIGSTSIFSRKWGVGADGKLKRFDEIVTEYPITSGPYTIAAAEYGRRIEFKRNPDYWAKDLGVRRGFFNFDRVVYRFYRDHSIAREAFKAGEFDIIKEYGAASWMRQHKGPKWKDGRIIREPMHTEMGQGMQSYELNLRRAIFQDRRVRDALGYTYDFDTLNRYKLFKRTNSVFNNSDFAAQGRPSAGELALLEPFRSELPSEVFGPAFVAPDSNVDPKQLRANLLRARALLADSGWKLAPDGKLRNAKGDAFVIEYLTPEESARLPEWELNLQKLGIELKIRKVDYALYRRRLQQYDFDVIMIVEPRFTLPWPSDLMPLYGSAAADEPGNNNYRGVKSKAVDHLLDVMGRAKTLDELRDATRALDRVVMWNHWQVPDLYQSDEWASYWNKFGKPAGKPKFFTIDSPQAFPMPWPLMTWWCVKC